MSPWEQMMNKSQHQPGMSLIVRTTTRLTVGFVLLYGVYLVVHGHVSPGGGFTGGVIIALAFVQLMLAYGKATALSKMPKGVSAFFESMGALIFLSLALLGFTGGYFFLNFISKGEPFHLFSAGIIPLANVAISLKVGTGLFAIFIALVLLKYEPENKE
jgi:multisubunit Na+/H+ antiporter MnhB subunit